jgi:hypothetical protein
VAYWHSPETTHDSTRALIKSYQTNQGRNGQLRQDERLNNEATAIQTMTEWGIRAFQESLPWSKEKKSKKEEKEKYC